MTHVSEPAARAVGERRTPDQGDAQRARIIDALVELLDTHPIAEVSVMRIAKQAGITRPTFYVYFESSTPFSPPPSTTWKQFKTARFPIAAVDPQLTPAEVTRRLTDSAVQVWSRHHRLIAAVLEARSSDEQLARLWDGLLEQNREQIRSVLELLRAAGHIRPVSDDLPALVEALFGMTVWSLVNSTWPDDPGKRSPPTPRRRDLGDLAGVGLGSRTGFRSPVDQRSRLPGDHRYRSARPARSSATVFSCHLSGSRERVSACPDFPDTARSRITDVNDGIIAAVAGMSLGLAGAEVSRTTAYAVITISAVVGALSVFGAELGEGFAQREAELATVAEEQRLLELGPEEEIEELVEWFEAKGVSTETSRKVAEELSDADALSAQLGSVRHPGTDQHPRCLGRRFFGGHRLPDRCACPCRHRIPHSVRMAGGVDDHRGHHLVDRHLVRSGQHRRIQHRQDRGPFGDHGRRYARGVPFPRRLADLTGRNPSTTFTPGI